MKKEYNYEDYQVVNRGKTILVCDLQEDELRDELCKALDCIEEMLLFSQSIREAAERNNYYYV